MPGLCIATLGPGATNLATGVGNAWLDRSPMIAITCNLNTDQLGRRIQMWIDHHALFKPITKATLRLEAGRIGETVTEAIRMALSEPRGASLVSRVRRVGIGRCSFYRRWGRICSQGRTPQRAAQES